MLASLPHPDHSLAGDVARHAVLGRDASLCAHACVRGAGRCLELFATREVRELVGLGRDQLGALPIRERIGLEIQLLHLAILADGAGRDTLEHALARAIEEAQHIGSHEDAALGLHALSIILHGRGDYEQARVSSLRADTLTRMSRGANAAKGHARAGLCLALLERNLAQAEGALAEAERRRRLRCGRRLLEQTGGEIPDAILGRAVLDRYRGNTDVAIERFERALAFGDHARDHYITRTALLAAALDLERDDRVSATARARESLSAHSVVTGHGTTVCSCPSVS